MVTRLSCVHTLFDQRQECSLTSLNVWTCANSSSKMPSGRASLESATSAVRISCKYPRSDRFMEGLQQGFTKLEYSGEWTRTRLSAYLSILKYTSKCLSIRG